MMNKEFRDWLERAIEITQNNTQSAYNISALHEQKIILERYNELHKPVEIPKYVADWITRYREKYDLYPALRLLDNNTFVWGEIHEWYRMNTRKFVNAYLTGEYEVEEEPKCYAMAKGHELVNDYDIYWNCDKYDRDVFVSRLHPPHDNFSTELSKEEWNELGINDSNADFVEVEE